MRKLINILCLLAIGSYAAAQTSTVSIDKELTPAERTLVGLYFGFSEAEIPKEDGDTAIGLLLKSDHKFISWFTLPEAVNSTTKEDPNSGTWTLKGNTLELTDTSWVGMKNGKRFRFTGTGQSRKFKFDGKRLLAPIHGPDDSDMALIGFLRAKDQSLADQMAKRSRTLTLSENYLDFMCKQYVVPEASSVIKYNSQENTYTISTSVAPPAPWGVQLYWTLDSRLLSGKKVHISIETTTFETPFPLTLAVRKNGDPYDPKGFEKTFTPARGVHKYEFEASIVETSDPLMFIIWAGAATGDIVIKNFSLKVYSEEEEETPISLTEPGRFLELLGRNQSALESVFGKPTRVLNQANGGTFVAWGVYPHAVASASFDTQGQMESFGLQAAATWQATLEKYGLSVDGVTAKETKGDGGAVAYKLSNIAWIPDRWTCTWYNSGLEFRIEH